MNMDASAKTLLEPIQDDRTGQVDHSNRLIAGAAMLPEVGMLFANRSGVRRVQDFTETD